MSEAMIRKIYEDVEFLKKKMLDLDSKFESRMLEFEELSEKDIDFFVKAFDKTKNTGFWVPRRK